MYPWVSNPAKYNRALAALKADGKEATEEAVKALYVRYGGLVLETPIVEAETEEPPTPAKKHARK
jgi:hypothetical protein